MNGLGNGQREWTMEEKFEKIAEAGFTGILGALPQPHEAAQWRKLLDQYNLSFGITSFPYKREDLIPILKHAKDFGVQYINSQVMDSFVIDEEAVTLLKELTEEAAAQGVPYFVETHRGRVTQDLLRTVEYVKAIPDLRLTIDLSHYVVAGEMVGSLEKVEPLFDSLLRRTSSIHARVSNGEQVQVDIGPNGEHPMVPSFMRWWIQGITYWLQQAKTSDILPFVIELGPPSYSITTNNFHSNKQEISDRWQQALVLKSIAEKAWHQAQAQSFN
ncbi:TIM barrel protein [Paenibacillus sp. S3N08]|uniref:TIM barrel protein n=2 Tax=Paenibacillus agricola TaxID=2716264 RepID=A0ABX0J753_9BACL|nr:TIM barrel protein [Paenibacillus agricola]